VLGHENDRLGAARRRQPRSVDGVERGVFVVGGNGANDREGPAFRSKCDEECRAPPAESLVAGSPYQGMRRTHGELGARERTVGRRRVLQRRIQETVDDLAERARSEAARVNDRVSSFLRAAAGSLGERFEHRTVVGVGRYTDRECGLKGTAWGGTSATVLGLVLRGGEAQDAATAGVRAERSRLGQK
jgi:hypothetical protein